jgi:hypothetical protein
MPVGKVRPETIVTGGPCRLTRTIAPVPRVGPPALVAIMLYQVPSGSKSV